MNRTQEQIVSIGLYILTAGVLLIPISTHHSMVRGCARVKKLKRATYKELKEKMLTVNWIFDANYPNSLFTEDYYSNYFHASIFRFGDVGYLMTAYGWIMANVLQRKIRKNLEGFTLSGKPFID